MPADGKVSLTRQTIYCFIPLMDIYAAYHIKKLRWYLIVMIGAMLAFGGVSGAVYPMSEVTEYNQEHLFTNQEINWAYTFLGENPELSIALFVLGSVVEYGVAVYAIRRWSKEWNIQFN